MKLPSTSQRRSFFVRVISGVVSCHTGNRYAATVPFSAMERCSVKCASRS
jgi:hypothetical protein